jgi:hypothetical protein
MVRFVLQSERLGPLPLVNHFIQRMALEDTLDRYVPSDQRCALSRARALGVLLRSIIVEREPIYGQQETVHGFASGMFGVGEEEMQHVGDDRIGRALDRLFDADRAALHRASDRPALWRQLRCTTAVPRSAFTEAIGQRQAGGFAHRRVKCDI